MKPSECFFIPLLIPIFFICFVCLDLSLNQTVISAAGSPDEHAMSQPSLAAKGADNVILDKILTIVNNDVITESELLRDFAWFRIYYPEQLYGKNEQEAMLYILEKKIDQRLLVQEIQKTQFVTIPKNQVDMLFRKVSNRFGSLEILEAIIEKIHFSKNEFYQYLWTELLIEQYIQQKFKPRVRVTASEIGDFLSRNYKEYGLELEEIEQVDKENVAQAHERVKSELVRMKSALLLKDRIEQLKSEADIKSFLSK